MWDNGRGREEEGLAEGRMTGQKGVRGGCWMGRVEVGCGEGMRQVLLG